MLSCQFQLVTVYCAGRKEIYYGLNPQGNIFRADVLECGSHGVESDEASYAECRWEQICHGLPCSRHRTLWPRHARKEKKGYGGEYHYKEDVLAVADNARYGHAKEYCGQKEWYHQSQ